MFNSAVDEDDRAITKVSLDAHLSSTFSSSSPQRVYNSNGRRSTATARVTAVSRVNDVSLSEEMSSAHTSQVKRNKRKERLSETAEDESMEVSIAKRSRPTIAHHFESDQSDGSHEIGRKPVGLYQGHRQPSTDDDGLPPPYPSLRYPFPWDKLKAQALREIVTFTLGIPFVGNKRRAILRLTQVQTEGLDKAIEAEQQYKRENPISSAKARRQKATAEEPSIVVRRSERKRAVRQRSLEEILAGPDDDVLSDYESASGSPVGSVSAVMPIQRTAAKNSSRTRRSQRKPAVEQQEDTAVTGDNTPDDLYYSAWSPLSTAPQRDGKDVHSIDSVVALPPMKREKSFRALTFDRTSPSHFLESKPTSPPSSIGTNYFFLPHQLQRDRNDTMPSANMFGNVARGYSSAHTSTWTNIGQSEAVSSKNEFDDVMHLLPSIMKAPRGSKEYKAMASFVLFELSTNSKLENAIRAADSPDMKEELIRLLLEKRMTAMSQMEA
ncbi:hypothetical protein BDZ89DRAFT_1230845 [Hymenopellis radicata]|nr:hypothetical protein BDZ89DRAFT_1230845 [Hymenopellis radicata]